MTVKWGKEKEQKPDTQLAELAVILPYLQDLRFFEVHQRVSDLQLM